MGLLIGAKSSLGVVSAFAYWVLSGVLIIPIHQMRKQAQVAQGHLYNAIGRSSFLKNYCLQLFSSCTAIKAIKKTLFAPNSHSALRRWLWPPQKFLSPPNWDKVLKEKHVLARAGGVGGQLLPNLLILCLKLSVSVPLASFPNLSELY